MELTVVDDTLWRQAELQEESEHKANYRSEFRYGPSFRTLALPAGTKEEDVTTTYKKGVLEARAPHGSRRNRKDEEDEGHRWLTGTTAALSRKRRNVNRFTKLVHPE